MVTAIRPPREGRHVTSRFTAARAAVSATAGSAGLDTPFSVSRQRLPLMILPRCWAPSRADGDGRDVSRASGFTCPRR